MSAITIEPTMDESYIKSVLFNPSIYSQVIDDACPQDATSPFWENIMAVPGIFLRVLVEGIPAGVFWVIYKNDRIEAHTFLMENCRGIRAIKATKQAIQWVFGHTKAKAIDSFAFSDCPAVGWFCRAVGLKETKTEHWPNTRRGYPVDITYFSIERGAI